MTHACRDRFVLRFNNRMGCQTRSPLFFSTLRPWPNAVVALLFFLAGTGCSSLSERKAGAFARPSDLVATMPDPYDVHLRWKNHATVEGGNLVEFQLWPQGANVPSKERNDFLILDFLKADETTFQHTDLGAETVLTYRIHPFFGKSSEPVPITTGSAEAAKTEPEEPEGPLEEPPVASRSQKGDLHSIRRLATFAEAVPTDVVASLSGTTHVVLRWKEHAADADGYFVELSLHPDKDFQVCALLPPHTTSFRKTGLPPETRLYFRVRAFFYGRPSNSVTETTGPERIEVKQSRN